MIKAFSLTEISILYKYITLRFVKLFLVINAHQCRMYLEVWGHFNMLICNMFYYYQFILIIKI